MEKGQPFEGFFYLNVWVKADLDPEFIRLRDTFKITFQRKVTLNHLPQVGVKYISSAVKDEYWSCTPDKISYYIEANSFSDETTATFYKDDGKEKTDVILLEKDHENQLMNLFRILKNDGWKSSLPQEEILEEFRSWYEGIIKKK